VREGEERDHINLQGELIIWVTMDYRHSFKNPPSDGPGSKPGFRVLTGSLGRLGYLKKIN
jgi:hypothetical protein